MKDKLMIRFSVLGCGRIGTMHARNLARHPKARLTSVFDVFTKASDAMAAELGVKAAASIDEVLADPEVDAVLIATSTDTHVELITAAARAGKAILCEKPIALDMAKVEQCWAEISSLNATVMIGFNRRFDPSFRAVHDRHDGRRDRPPGADRHHQPRPCPAPDRLHQRVRRICSVT